MERIGYRARGMGECAGEPREQCPLRGPGEVRSFSGMPRAPDPILAASGLPRIERRGRPTKLSRAILEEIAKHIREGARAKDATLASGVSMKTWYRWNDEAEDPKADPIYHEFRLICEGTHALCKVTVAKKMYDAAKEGDPANWAKHVGMEGFGANRVELSGPEGGPMQVETPGALMENLLDTFEQMAERRTPGKGPKK